MHHGKEIYLFFAIYGINGVIGIIIAQSIIGMIIYKVLIICQRNKIKNYGTFIEQLNRNKKINEIMNIIINTFLLITFYVMIAGFSAYFSQELGISNIIRNNNNSNIMLYNFYGKHRWNNKNKYIINSNTNYFYNNTRNEKY